MAEYYISNVGVGKIMAECNDSIALRKIWLNMKVMWL